MRRSLVLLALAAVLLLAGCTDSPGSPDGPAGPDGPDGTSSPSVTLGPQQELLFIETQGWTGWSTDQPEPDETSVVIEEGSTFEVMDGSSPITITVTALDDDGIDIETDRSLVVDEGGIDFDAATTSFTIIRGEPLTLSTPTMDGGTTFTFSVA